ncbi:MAG: hypothetical protein QXY49_04570 [Thermofilaceae archaeon]
MIEEPLLSSEISTYEKFIAAIEELEGTWKEYVEKVNNLLSEWEKTKVKLLEKISKVEGLLKAVNEELEELKVEAMLGLLNEDETKNRLDYLEQRKTKLESRLKSLKDILEDIEIKMAEHGTRVKKR